MDTMFWIGCFAERNATLRAERDAPRNSRSAQPLYDGRTDGVCVCVCARVCVLHERVKVIEWNWQKDREIEAMSAALNHCKRLQ